MTYDRVMTSRPHDGREGMPSRPWPPSSVFRLTTFVLASACLASGCGAPNDLPSQASRPWSQHYTLADGGEFQVVAANGLVDAQASDGPDVEVQAERIARAKSDGQAELFAERIRIAEDVAPDRVVLRDEGIPGVVVGAESRVNFHVRVPASARLRIYTANGDITTTGVRGAVVLASTNGAVKAAQAGGPVEVRSTNGAVTIDVAASDGVPVDVHATNGDIALVLPSTARADVDAACTNGAVAVAGLSFEASGEQLATHARGRVHGGGVPVTLATTNGDIHVRPRP